MEFGLLSFLNRHAKLRSHSTSRDFAARSSASRPTTRSVRFETCEVDLCQLQGVRRSVRRSAKHSRPIIVPASQL